MILPPHVDVVLFDWDGTLADSAEASYRCYEDLFGSLGIAFDRAVFQRTYSPDWLHTYRALGVPEERWDEASARWLERYCRETIPLVAGAREALARLHDAGLRLAIVTSGDRSRVLRELHQLDVERYFGVVVCGGDVARKKPDPEGLILALRRLDVATGRAVYVGDSPEDVVMARRAGVPCIGIPGGFPNREALAAAAPDLAVDSLDAAVDALTAGR